MADWTSLVGPDMTPAGGTVGSAVAVFGNGASFDAADAAQLSATDAGFDVTAGVGHKSWSIAGWYRGTKQAADTTIFNFSSTLALRHGGTDGVHDGEIVCRLPTTGGSDWYYSAPGVLTDDTKYHIVVRCKWAFTWQWERTFEVFVNDSPWIDRTEAADEFTGGTSIAISQTSASRQLEATYVDDVGLWIDYWLTDADITALYNSGTGSSIEDEFGPGHGAYADMELYNQLEGEAAAPVTETLYPNSANSEMKRGTCQKDDIPGDLDDFSTTVYSSGEEDTVSTDDTNYVTQAAISGYAVAGHRFKLKPATIAWADVNAVVVTARIGPNGDAPSFAGISIWNYNTSFFETMNCEHEPSGTDVTTIRGIIESDIANYYDGSGYAVIVVWEGMPDYKNSHLCYLQVELMPTLALDEGTVIEVVTGGWGELLSAYHLGTIINVYTGGDRGIVPYNHGGTIIEVVTGSLWQSVPRYELGSVITVVTGAEWAWKAYELGTVVRVRTGGRGTLITPDVREIPDNAADLAALKSSKAINAIKVEWGGATGDEWYADTDRTVDGVSMDGRVTAWGDAVARLGQRGSFRFALQDTDSTIRDIVDSVGSGGHVTTLYQLWPSLSQADWVILWVGITEDDIEWDEADPVIRINCQDYGWLLREPLNKIVNKADFPYAEVEAFGTALPIVYGRKRGVEAVCVSGGGPRSITTSGMTPTSTYVYVEDVTDIPDKGTAANPVRLWVGRELIAGYFDGNKFLCTERSVQKYPTGGGVGYAQRYDANPYQAWTFQGYYPAGYFNGFAMKLKIPGTTVWQYRAITTSTYVVGTNTVTIWLRRPFSYGPPWQVTDYGEVTGYTPWAPESGVDYEFAIVSQRSSHKRGVSVRFAPTDGSVTYILNDRASSDVVAVYCNDQLMPAGTYTLDEDDDRFAGVLDHNCTTCTFRMPPEYIRWTDVDERIIAQGPYSGISAFTGRVSFKRRKGSQNVLATVYGPEEGSPAELIQHPARVIRHLALRAGLDAGDIDTDSITAARQATPGYRCAFALEDTTGRACEALEDLARLAECAIDWTEGALRLVRLDNEIQDRDAVATFSTERRMDSYRRRRGGLRAVTTKFVGRYANHRNEAGEEVVRDLTAMAASGLLTDTINAWPYAHGNPVKAACSFLLYRKRYAPDAITLECFLDRFAVRLGDIISTGSRKGWIEEISYHPGSQRADIDRISFTMAVPPDDWYDTTWNYPDPSYEDPDFADQPTTEEIPDLVWPSGGGGDPGGTAVIPWTGDYVTVGTTEESDDANPARVGIEDTWGISGQTPKGVDLVVLTRMAYMHDGNQKLYGYYRTLRVDGYGRVIAVSSEAQIEIDAPVVPSA